MCKLLPFFFLLRIWQFWAPKFENFSWGADPPSLQYLRSFTFSPKSLFGASNGLKELPEMRFEVLFNLIGKSTMAL